MLFIRNGFSGFLTEYRLRKQLGRQHRIQCDRRDFSSWEIPFVRQAMLIKISVENFKSFDQKEELSMFSSSKIQTNKSHRLKIKQTNLLKNAVVYGANASGKSNLVTTAAFIKNVLLEGLPVNSVNDFCRNNMKNKERKSVFEIQFTVGNTSAY